MISSRTLTFTAAAAMAVLAAACGAVPDHRPGDDDGRPDASVPMPDAGPDAPLPMIDPAIDGKLVINELMAANAVTIADGPGAGLDWIELYNPTDQVLALNGYALTDDLMTPRKSVLPTGVSIAAHGRLLLWADNEPARGADHLGFGLDADGGDLALVRPDGTFIDRVRYGEQEVDFSAAREPDASDHWVIEWHPTAAAANPAGPGHPMGLEVPTDPPEMVPAAGDLSESILGYDEDPEIALRIGQADVAALRANPRVYVRGYLSFQGREYGPVGIRLKGGNSFETIDAKPSWKINVDEYVPGARFWGLGILTLNNMDDDLSMMHERLAYWVARRAQLPASRCNHARITVNGTLYGLYANVETVKHGFLKRWFEDADGPLFEATDVDFAAPYLSQYELESGPDDRSMLVGLANALAMPDPDQAIAAAAAFVDLDQFRKFWAMESVIGQFDAFPYSMPGDDYFVYADPTHKLTFIPWGMDETFFSADFDVTMVTGGLAQKCKASPACFQAYVNAVWDMMALVESIDLEAERARVAARIAPYVEADSRKPYTNADVQTFQANQHWFIVERRMHLAAMLPPRA